MDNEPQDDVMTQEQEVLRGRRAQALIRDPLIQEALQQLDVAFYQAFTETDPAEVGQLSRIRLLVKCLEEFKGFFFMAIETGQLTERNIKLDGQEAEALERLERQRLRG